MAAVAGVSNKVVAKPALDKPVAKSVSEVNCIVILKSGANKGSECGKKCMEGKKTCSIHSK